jgi:hypothetical protein
MMDVPEKSRLEAMDEETRFLRLVGGDPEVRWLLGGRREVFFVERIRQSRCRSPVVLVGAGHLYDLRKLLSDAGYVVTIDNQSGLDRAQLEFLDL